MTTGCQLNIVRCSVNQSDLLGNFGPEQHQRSAAWIRYSGTGPPHIVMLQLKDIVGDSATKVRINAVLESIQNTSPFPFVFTVINANTGTYTESSVVTIVCFVQCWYLLGVSILG